MIRVSFRLSDEESASLRSPELDAAYDKAFAAFMDLSPAQRAEWLKRQREKMLMDAGFTPPFPL